MCLTYGRPERLQESIECFLRQDYAGPKELVILNDCQEQQLVLAPCYDGFNERDDVKIINREGRGESLGQLRNECVAACRGEVIVLWDDDDIFWPGYLTMMQQLTDGRDWASHRNIFHMENFVIKSIQAGAGAWIAFRKDAWEKVGGYAHMNSGEDHDFRARLAKLSPEQGKVCQPHEIQFGYGWNNGVYHMSGQGSDKPGHKTGVERQTEHVAREIQAGRVPRGTVVLRPGWQRDYMQIRADYLASLEVPKLSALEYRTTFAKTIGKAPVFDIGIADEILKSQRPKLSIIINVLNDQEELTATIHSIRQTAGEFPEIIVVDDCSDQRALIDPRDKNLKLVRNQVRIGCGASRHVGAIEARGEYLLIIDSHMRFEPGWYEEALSRITAKPDTIYCGTCLGLGEGQMDMITGCEFRMATQVGRGQICSLGQRKLWCMNASTLTFQDVRTGELVTLTPNDKVGIYGAATYTGARMNFCGPDSNRPDQFQVFEAVWKDHPTDDMEIGALMGASYFIRREVFFKLGGLRQLKMWGCDEPYLSLKAWLAGHEVRILRSVRIGHKFRTCGSDTEKFKPKNNVPYSVPQWGLLYSKIRCIMTIFNDDEAEYLIARLRQGASTDVWAQVMQLIAQDKADIMETARAYRAMFVRDIRWYCEKFELPYFLDNVATKERTEHGITVNA